MDNNNFTFKVGQVAEARTFESGYRGAWFRCKIIEVCRKKGNERYAVEYFDFPDENIERMALYRKPGKSKDPKLMLRPCFPPVYHENELPDISTISEVAVIVNDVWKVGDLVDWWSDNCYWSGRLVEILGNEKFRLKLFPPPVGEGLSYDASCKDLRPSLDWSPEHGWTVPIPKGSKDCRSCAWLFKPVNQGGFKNLTAHAVDERGKDCKAAFASHISASYLPPLDGSEPEAKGPTAYMKTQQLENKDLTDSGDPLVEVAEDTEGKDSQNDNGPSKKMKTDGSISLNSMCSDTIEAAILDLEELVNRVKWIKDILEFGIPLPNSVRPSWKFLEHRASSLPK